MAPSAFLVGIDDIVSSKARMHIASLISTRPRTLGELSDMTGISVQGVLKHLMNLRKSGILSETELRGGRHLKYRKVYAIDGKRFGDFSRGDVMVAHLSGEPRAREESDFDGNAYEELETLAEDALIFQRRIQDTIKRMGRLIEELVSTQRRLTEIVRTIRLDKEEQQIANIFFTEEGTRETKRILSRYYGSEDPEGALREVLEKIKGR